MWTLSLHRPKYRVGTQYWNSFNRWRRLVFLWIKRDKTFSHDINFMDHIMDLISSMSFLVPKIVHCILGWKYIHYHSECIRVFMTLFLHMTRPQSHFFYPTIFTQIHPFMIYECYNQGRRELYSVESTTSVKLISIYMERIQESVWTRSIPRLIVLVGEVDYPGPW